MAKTKNKSKFAVGQWVEAVKGKWSMSKGTLAVVAYVEEQTDYNENGNIVPNGEFTYRVVFVNKNGNPDQCDVEEKGIKAITAPKFLVAWSTEDTDPMRYFKTKNEAVAFKNKILGKKYAREKVVEARVFTA